MMTLGHGGPIAWEEDRMKIDPLNYGNMVEAALRSVVRDALSHVERQGLPGSHHFYISFFTQHPDTAMADYLRQRFPHEMTIVIQHQFWDLKVEQDGFAVTLSFNQAPETLYIPFSSLTSFADPSAQFRLEFHTLEEGEEAAFAAAEETSGQKAAAVGEETPRKSADVVALDSFRKK